MVRKLQTSLQAKAKAEPDFRFYSLWDKVCRADVLEEAYRACRRNDGAPGCDGMTFDQITAYGQDRWLEELRQELRAGDYRPQPLLRVWIPKSNGGQRPLGIPCIRDRVVEMAALLVLGRSSRRTCCAISTASVRRWTPRWRFARPSGTLATMAGQRW
jgi:retron-type reverse transcriptase